jgi:hypothetical protein
LYSIFEGAVSGHRIPHFCILVAREIFGHYSGDQLPS